MAVKKMLDLWMGHCPGPDIDFGDVRYANHEHGWVVFVNPAMLEHARSFPDWLRPIMKKAIELDCILINFDTDAEQLEEFEVFDW